MFHYLCRTQDGFRNFYETVSPWDLLSVPLTNFLIWVQKSLSVLDCLQQQRSHAQIFINSGATGLRSAHPWLQHAHKKAKAPCTILNAVHSVAWECTSNSFSICWNFPGHIQNVEFPLAGEHMLNQKDFLCNFFCVPRHKILELWQVICCHVTTKLL